MGKEKNEETKEEVSEEKKEEESEEKSEEDKESLQEKTEKLKKELEEERELAQKYYKALQRVQADLENYQKRVKREKKVYVKYANENLITSLLEVLDNFQRALNSAQENKDKESLIEGVKMIRNQLHSLLEREGLQEIDAEGEIFDPEKHEAVDTVPTEEHEEDAIIEELQKGYKLHEKVIRPSRVKIAKPTQEKGGE